MGLIKYIIKSIKKYRQKQPPNCMQKIDKKKRHTSGSRSKSKKSKPNDASIDMKPNRIYQPNLPTQQHTSKNKTQNSLNKQKQKDKSKGKKSNGVQNITKLTNSKKNKICRLMKANNKGFGDQSKQLSRSVSAERKHSLVKMNRTQANFQNQDIERRIYAVKKSLSKIERPSSIKTRELLHFYRQIQDSIEMVSQPLYSLLYSLHELYMTPILQILDMIAPYEQLLSKKQHLSRELDEQVKHNEQMYKQLTQQEIHILNLKETIENQRLEIEQKKKQENKKRSELLARQMEIGKGREAVNKQENRQDKNKKQEWQKVQIKNQKKDRKYEEKEKQEILFKNEGVIRNMKKDKEKYQIVIDNHDFSVDKDRQKQKSREKQIKPEVTFKEQPYLFKQSEPERDSQPHIITTFSNGQPASKTMSLGQGMKGGLKLDLGAMNKSETVGFHDQFYSKIGQFSESWRNQALREKRF